jgi:IPT/TIG domain-containing protein
MRAFLVLLICTLTVVSIAVASDAPVRPTPVIKTVAPTAAKCGDELVASGDNLSEATVDSLYLTAGEATLKVVIVKQTETSIKFKVPEGAKPGRLGLMVLTAGGQAHYIDEPVYITVSQ